MKYVKFYVLIVALTLFPLLIASSVAVGRFLTRDQAANEDVGTIVESANERLTNLLGSDDDGKSKLQMAQAYWVAAQNVALQPYKSAPYQAVVEMKTDYPQGWPQELPGIWERVWESRNVLESCSVYLSFDPAEVPAEDIPARITRLEPFRDSLANAKLLKLDVSALEKRAEDFRKTLQQRQDDFEHAAANEKIKRAAENAFVAKNYNDCIDQLKKWQSPPALPAECQLLLERSKFRVVCLDLLDRIEFALEKRDSNRRDWTSLLAELETFFDKDYRDPPRASSRSAADEEDRHDQDLHDRLAAKHRELETWDTIMPMLDKIERDRKKPREHADTVAEVARLSIKSKSDDVMKEAQKQIDAWLDSGIPELSNSAEEKDMKQVLWNGRLIIGVFDDDAVSDQIARWKSAKDKAAGLRPTQRHNRSEISKGPEEIEPVKVVNAYTEARVKLRQNLADQAIWSDFADKCKAWEATLKEFSSLGDRYKTGVSVSAEKIFALTVSGILGGDLEELLNWNPARDAER